MNNEAMREKCSITGSTDPKRIVEATKAPEVDLTRDEWYRLLLAARGEKLP